MNSNPPKPATWKGLKVEYWGIFGLIIFTAAAFFPVIKADFLLLQDPEYVTENPVIKQGITWYGLKWSIFSWDSGQWHPVTWLSHMLDVSIWGLNPTGHHLTNLILHTANAMLVFLLLQKMTVQPLLSWLAALIFAIHPVQTESVAWISARQDLLSATFLFLAIFAYLRYLSGDPPKRYLLIVFFFGLGLTTKFTAMALPLYLLILDYWPLKRLPNELPWETAGAPEALNLQEPPPDLESATDRKSAFHYLCTEKIFLFSLSLFILLIAISCVHLAGHWGTGETFPFITRLGNAIISYPSNLFSILLPTGLTFYYPVDGAVSWLDVIDALAVQMIVVTLVVYFGRRRPYLIVGALWFCVGLLPTIGVLQFGSQAHADRFLYVPLLGIAIMAVWGIDELCASFQIPEKIVFTATSAVLLLLLGMTSRQTGYWKTTEALVRRGITLNAGNAFAHNLFGIVLGKQGKSEESREQYLKASKLNPRFADTHFHLGALTFDKGDNATAVEFLKRAIKLNPHHYRAYSYLGRAYASSHHTKAGCDSMFEALIIHPSYEEGRIALCKWNAYRGHLSDAIRDYERILKANPVNIEAINNMGILLAFRNRREEAIQRLQFALNLKPKNSEVNNNIGVLWMHNGKSEKAIHHLATAIQQAPTNAQISYNLGMAYHSKTNYEQAAKYYHESLKLSPAFKDARDQYREASAGRPPVRSNSGRAAPRAPVIGIWSVDGLIGTTFIPDFRLARRQLEYGAALQRQGLHEQAIQQYSNAIRLNPYLSEPHIALGKIFYQKHWLQRSLNHYMASLNLNSSNPAAYNGIGIVLVKATKYDDAISNFKRALSLKPDFDLANKNLKSALRLQKSVHEKE